jgi:hypothetical protein
MTYDMSGVDRDDPQPMRGTLRVRVDPADRKPIDFLTAPRTPLAEVEFIERPDPEAAREVSAVLGLPDESSEPVPLTCRIEEDGSLLCADASGSTDPELARVAAGAARVVATSYRAAPKLRSGGPSSGRVVDLTP